MLRVHLFKSKFYPAGMVLYDSASLCRFFVINLFDKKIYDFVTFGTQIFEL